jgi:predicted phosphate transport protein (TIGR00153 family)
MGLQDFIQRLLPRHDEFFELLERQAGVARKAAQALASFADEDKTAAAIMEQVQAIEHEGDKLVHEIEEALARTFVTPIDREDIHLLASSIDDVLDLTNYAARACAMLGVERPTAPMVALMKVLVEATTVLADGLPALRRRAYLELRTSMRSIRKIEKEGDRIHREAVSELFRSEPIDAKVLLREREVLEDLENAIDRCEKVADTLSNLAVKHG